MKMLALIFARSAFSLGLLTALATQPTAAAGTGCEQNGAAKPPATSAETGPKSGTAPGNMGSTGWTGGTGGSHMDASADRASKSDAQPETAKGLDPIKDTGPAKRGC